MRTLLVCQGLETNRILAAVSIHAPNRVVLLRNTNEVSDKVRKDVQVHIDKLRGLLSKKKGVNPYPFVFSVEEKELDFFDVPGAFSELDSLLEQYSTEGEVFVDISSGAKTISIALFLAAQQNSVPITYCKAADYLDSTEEIVAIAKEPVWVPRLPIQLADLDWNVLAALAKAGSVGSMSSLLKKMSKPTSKSEIVSLSRRVEKLAEYGYVEIKRVGKSKSLAVTKEGRQAARLGKD